MGCPFVMVSKLFGIRVVSDSTETEFFDAIFPKMNFVLYLKR